MQGPEILIPLSMFIGGFTMVIFLRRYIYLERKMMIERGMSIGDFSQRFRNINRGNPASALRFGLLAIGVGLGLFIGNRMGGEDMHQREGTTFGLVFMFGGIGLVTSYLLQMYIERNQPKENGYDAPTRNDVKDDTVI